MSSYEYNLSDVWREIKSSDPGTELAGILSAAKVMVQTLVPEMDVELAGMNTARTDRRILLASAGPLGNTYPVPGDKLDVFLGQVVHETAHRLFSPDEEETARLLKSLRGKTVKAEDFPVLRQLMAAVEDALIDFRLSGFPAYKAYFYRASMDALKKVDLDEVLKPLSRQCTRQNMINALALALIAGKQPVEAATENLETLNTIIQITRDFCAEKLSRRKCLLACWEELCKYPVSLKLPGTGEDAGSGGSHGGAIGGEVNDDISIPYLLDRCIDEKEKLADDVAQDVAQAIIEKREDLTDITRLLIGYTTHSVLIFTPEEDAFEVQRAWGKTQDVEQQLIRIFQDFRQKHTRHFRGLYAGKISSRRLYRTGYGDIRVFQRRDRPEELELALCLLMDCSHSVYEYRSLINEVVISISNAMCKEKAGFMAMGYSERYGQVHIARLFDQETGKVRLAKDKLFGNTPSHEGLAAAIAQLLRLGDKKDRLLIHFTDGQPTSARRDEIPSLLDDARARGIRDYHVALSSKVAQFCQKWYGEKVTIIDRIEDLPVVIEDILRTELEVKDI